MRSAIEASGGRVDKFIGDRIIALFGVNGNNEDGANHALKAAHEMSLRLKKMNEKLKNDLKVPLSVGIGIHHGPVIVGTIGYWTATQITAISDTVNTASRLEALTKDCGVQLLASSEVKIAAQIDLKSFEKIEIRVRTQTLCIQKINLASELPISLLIESSPDQA
jgi:adenylate cyclase